MKTCVIDGKEILSQEMLHDVLAGELEFPEWYGRNLDALYDCLTDMREDCEIRVVNTEDLGKHLDVYVRSFLRMLKDTAENGRVHIVIE